jgi:pyruvate/2-oxoglutarate dehydrogenase complex dihydrolipoamide dehydrogenase (E3) component
MVVGGGPAGMEAARVARLAGHKVVLAEAMPMLGGALNVAKRAPYLQTFGDLVSWFETELRHLGVEIRLNAYVEPDDVRAEAPDVLIVATGSQPRMDGVQTADPSAPARGVELPHVISSTELLTSKERELGRSALVVDSVGGYEALAVADHLIAKGLAVTFLSHDLGFATNARPSLRDDPALQRFYDGDFTLLIRHLLVEVRPGECDVRPVLNQRVRTVPADCVVLVTPNEPMRDLYLALAQELPRVVLVGDAVSPRDLQAAIAEGHHAARALRDAPEKAPAPAI